MDAFTMWEEKIIFLDGWFVYMDGKGNNSIISHDRARALEWGYQSYQASMDVNRGGAEREQAYPSRGFTLKGNDYVYENFRVDRLIVGKVNDISNVLRIPKTVGEYRINCIAPKAFKGETAIEEVVLHNDIHTIGESAFEGCKNLRDIDLSGKHINVKRDAFKETALHSSEITYLNNVLVKVQPTFKGALKVKEGTRAIADEALRDCKEITKVDLPDGLISIGGSAFENCQGLVDLSIPGSVETIGERAFSRCTGLSKIELPRTMKKIGMAAFSHCEALGSVILPECICEIEREMFYKCNSLTRVDIPKTVRKICVDAFEESGLLNAFESSMDDALYIGEWLICYKSDRISTLNIKEGTVGIADMDRCRPKKIRSVELPKSLKYIGDHAFLGALIHTVDLPQGLHCIGTAAFRGTSLKEVCVPSSVDEIGIWAFMDCESIKKITIKGSDTNIVWPAITGRKDKKEIMISAPVRSTADRYCTKYGKRYNLVFKPLAPSLLREFFKR